MEAKGVLFSVIAIAVAGIIYSSSIQSAIQLADNEDFGIAKGASAAFTFSGNVTSGQWVNVTNPSTNTIYTLEFNATRNGISELAECTITNCIVVNLTIGFNNSYRASGNLTNVINNVNGFGNASLAALVTAANTSERTTITADTRGTAGNNIRISESSPNMGASNPTLQNGQEARQGVQSVWGGTFIFYLLAGLLVPAIIILRMMQ